MVVLNGKVKSCRGLAIKVVYVSVYTKVNLREWSLITGRGGYKMGKSWVRKLFVPPPLKTG